MKEALSVLSGVLVVVAGVPYIRAIWRDRKIADGAKPMRVTWFVWAALDSVALAGMVAKNSVNWQIVVSAAVAWTVFFISLWYGKKGWTLTDKVCLVGAAVGIVLLFFDPRLGIAASLTSLLFGAIPTFGSAWNDPASESRFAWGVWWLSCIASLIAVPSWTVEAAAQPIVFMLIESVMVLILFARPSSWKR